MPSETRPQPTRWNFDLDRYINPFVVPAETATRYLPSILKRFVGHHEHAPRPLGNLLVIAWASVGTISSLSLIYIAGRRFSSLHDGGAPLILGSFGAAAVLEFYAIDSALSQPRNLVIGQLLGSVIGAGINKVFSGLTSAAGGRADLADLRWLAGVLSCACSTVAMGLTGTVHPPAGATALIAVTDDKVAAMGWTLVPLVLEGCALMLLVALLLNNIQRTFPAFWWTATGAAAAKEKKEGGGGGGGGGVVVLGSFWTASAAVMRGRGRGRGRSGSGGGAGGGGSDRARDLEAAGGATAGSDGVGGDAVSVGEEPKDAAATDSERGLAGGDAVDVGREVHGLEGDEVLSVTVSRRGIFVPPHVHLRAEERIWLEELRQRL